MFMKTLLILCPILILIGIAAVTSTAAGGGSCSACQGPVLTVTGQGWGTSCAGALNAAQADAWAQATANAPDCVPCQTSNGPQACYQETSTWRPPFRASFTLNYRCMSCPGGPF